MGEKEARREDLIRWFSELSNKDVPIAGGKGASLAEMYNHKFPVPPGFVITAQAYKYFIEKSGLKEKISDILNKLDVNDTASLSQASKTIREMIDNANMPKDLEQDIVEAYDVLDVDKKGFSDARGGALDILRNSHEPPFVAVRSSATTEDLADASFAGQQDSFLNIKGKQELIKTVKMCFSSLFTARAIYYRKKKGFSEGIALLSVVVQKMVDSVKSGVMFSKNPLKNDNSIIIEAVWGLGEGIVSGKILPDHYVLNSDFEITDAQVSDKKIAVVRAASGKITDVNLNPEKSSARVLSGHELKKLAHFALRLEEHYKKPQDIEFAIENDEIYIVQSRPITTQADFKGHEVSGNVLLSGLPASPGVSSGVVRIIYKLEELDKVKTGDVLVTKMTNPDMVVSMQKAAGIITDEGGITSHAAIVSREMGIPAIVGTKTATSTLKDGQIVTVDGNTGRVIEGKGIEQKVEINPIVPTKTHIKVIVDLPDYAERAAESKSTAVGLVRMEGVIAVSGKHPVWYVKNKKTEDYVELLHTGFKKLSKPFKEVWFRTSDIRSDEYSNLEGAPKEVEGNPMLGNHGVRFSLRNIDILESELQAIKELADDYPEKKFGIMLPQIISLEEVQRSKESVKKIGMPKNVKFGIMVETPAAVQIIEDICKEGIDFVSFGTNDLTQYTLAIDRNNPEVQDIYNEMHPAVLNSIKHVLNVCNKYGVESSICGQAGSKPEMAKFLVMNGIKSISVNADAAEKVSMVVAEIEKSLEGKMPSYPNSYQSQGESPARTEENRTNAPMKQIASEAINEEELILQALENGDGEYLPGFGVRKNQEVPDLNEAIPVSSEHFSSVKDNSIFDLNAQMENAMIDGFDKEINTPRPEDKSDEEKVASGLDDELRKENLVEQMQDAEEKVEHEIEQMFVEKDEVMKEDKVLDIF
ncbi:phosphoenolpyruvate synthase [Candidatus Pacearchaeota archaeon CG10_big_fil_rev_8_21_14_0_10_34_76]|nr:MAG: phosphoenolpyruvate synthase [Candidatus Pacearchaeota archaeon CG10_big_fil_rev_8_21_14_0_10_34_76]